MSATSNTGLNEQPGQNNQGTPTPAPTAAPNPAPAAASGDGNGKTVYMPTNALKRIKSEQLEKGKRAALAEAATQAGFSSVEEFLLALPKLKQAPAPAPQERQTRSNGNGGGRREERRESRLPASFDDRSVKQWQREKERLVKEKDQIAKKLRFESRRRKDEQRTRESLEAEMSLREKAILSGVKDVDYALRLLTRNLEGKTEQELEAFNEESFFTGLRESHPYLFGEKVVPATTGSGTSGAPGAPKPGDVAQATGLASKVDATKMSRDEYLAHIAKRGLQLAI